MDLFLLTGVATSLLVLIVTIWFFNKKNEKPAQAPQQRVPRRVEPGVPLRAQMARNQRNRARNALNEQARNQYDRVEDVAGDDAVERPAAQIGDEKMGTKKRAKLEAKAEKKAQREVELQLREEKKIRDAKAEEERKKLEEQAEENEKKREEIERLERELKEKQEYEEYLKMKEAFSVEEEGFEEDEKESDNLLQEFIAFIKNNKVVVLEDLAREFNLKTQATIDRIKELMANGMLSGVIDDRGKFIYISEDELAAVAKFIRQRGRISITELAESSNNLINLQPVTG
ncbi:DDRGK domain-containing protein 1 [Pseudolycoriella hygida]|uniref:DDRGK domain-containing protein 1 n=1 Tax=Pseudolycoriella hygida TaxID=35572 RepID=A0A9Q0MNI7_9DIPT|nr:DDRGK domain-containing protein 1 [Pseudolycoriella hygida]